MLLEDVLCEDILLEILLRLPVASLMRFKCVSKYFQSLILDPCFVTMHLQNSRRSTNFFLRYLNGDKTSWFVVPSPITSIEDSTSFFDDDIIHASKDNVLGSFNGLVCLGEWNEKGIVFYLWNPVTKEEFGNLTLTKKDNVAMLGFGYDNSRHTYNVVAIVYHLNSDHPFRTFIGSLNDESGWREIQGFLADPFIVEGDGIYLNNTLNWLGIPNYNDYEYDDIAISFDGVVIASLDLETETYTQMLLPHELNGVFIRDFCYLCEELHSNEFPLVGVLGGCLSLFLHNRRTKCFSIWQMKEFGNQKSWTLLLNTSLQDLGINTNIYSILLPLCMIENDRDIVIIHSSLQDCVKQIIIYDLKNNTVTFRNITQNLLWIYPFHYVESLVCPVA
ncbi:F-box/kelch-repeat protein At3g23880-like [Vigna unguiculata]|uniref:F-box/kelch-repeat protein At3g23880-like n=1 Tax=Vigna unguiculata TaxID=3917 RepID=UPI001015CD43|nr:F-box/kelch-repeat protein At3g23880-like [Vigna unguiculata]